MLSLSSIYICLETNIQIVVPTTVQQSNMTHPQEINVVSFGHREPEKQLILNGGSYSTLHPLVSITHKRSTSLPAALHTPDMTTGMWSGFSGVAGSGLRAPSAA